MFYILFVIVIDIFSENEIMYFLYFNLSFVFRELYLSESAEGGDVSGSHFLNTFFLNLSESYKLILS